MHNDNSQWYSDYSGPSSDSSRVHVETNSFLNLMDVTEGNEVSLEH
jgi:hypothetical protein